MVGADPALREGLVGVVQDVLDLVQVYQDRLENVEGSEQFKYVC